MMTNDGASALLALPAYQTFPQASPLMIQGGIKGGLDVRFRFAPRSLNPIWIPASAGMMWLPKSPLREA